MIGPQNPFCEELHATKYRGKGESFREAMNRIATGLADDSPHYKSFRDTILDQRFLPAGRVQAAIGSSRNVTASNCFISGEIEDSMESIMLRATEAAETMRMGGGVGYNFSNIRPRGDLICSLDSQASGPVSFMSIFNAICLTISSAGHRRGAQMGVLRIDHPDIEEFIRAKQNETELRGFNVSVAVTDEFMRSLEFDESFPLVWGGRTYKWVKARALWDLLMRSTWDWAEPGVLFIDRCNEMNNLHYCEEILATNPCGEQPMPADAACLLGSFNLARYAMPYGIEDDRLVADIGPTVRAMDNIVNRSAYPLQIQWLEAQNKRRMGLGVTGVANALEYAGLPYGSDGFCDVLERVLCTIANHSYRASAMLAKEKGSFPLFDRDQYLASKFVERLWPETRDLIAKHGIRNSHLTSIAPTGTISLTADNVSSGIEPVFAYSYDRTVNMPDGQRTVAVRDYGVEHFGHRGKIAEDVTIDEHLAVFEVAQRWVDSAVSKTCNIPSSTSWEDFKDVYFRAWKNGNKGCTTYRVGGKRFGVLNASEDGTSCGIDPATGRGTCD